MGLLSVVVGGQFGSEAKGAVTARLARQSANSGIPVAVVRVAGPNAGHTAYDDLGRKWALRTIPAASVDVRVDLFIGAGSEIDIPVLRSEVLAMEAAGIPIRSRLKIDAQATILTEAHHEAESPNAADLHRKIGSTGKGIGAARADRIMRTAKLAGDAEFAVELAQYGEVVHGTDRLLQDFLEYGHVIIEGTQGYGLGLHAGFYPQCTSSDTRAIDFLAMAGLDPHHADAYEVWVVLRRYPIRVAGNSGPLEGETSWEELGLPEELTTVTLKRRRVGEWDPNLANSAVRANGGPSVVRIALSMADQAIPGIAGVDGPALLAMSGVSLKDAMALSELISMVEHDAGAEVALVGTGPDSIIEL